MSDSEFIKTKKVYDMIDDMISTFEDILIDYPCMVKNSEVDSIMQSLCSLQSSILKDYEAYKQSSDFDNVVFIRNTGGIYE